MTFSLGYRSAAFRKRATACFIREDMTEVHRSQLNDTSFTILELILVLIECKNIELRTNCVRKS